MITIKHSIINICIFLSSQHDFKMKSSVIRVRDFYHKDTTASYPITKVNFIAKLVLDTSPSNQFPGLGRVLPLDKTTR